MAFCRKVVTFGVYEEMAPESFVAGRGIRTIAYTEIRDFRSERNEDGQYLTRLATRLEVLTADGRSVWGHEESDIVDLCRRRRTDFFIAQRVALPPTLPILVVAQLGHSVTFALAHLAGVQLVQQLVPAGARRNAQALYSGLVFGLGIVIGTAAAGPLYAAVGGAGSFLVAAAFSTVVAATWFVVVPRLGR